MNAKDEWRRTGAVIFMILAVLAVIGWLLAFAGCDCRLSVVSSPLGSNGAVEVTDTGLIDGNGTPPDFSSWESTSNEIARGWYDTRDFVLRSRSAVSNAVLFSIPPPGWRVVCDGRGHYAPSAPDEWFSNGWVLDDVSEVIRTNEWQAIVACWRVKEIWDMAPLSNSDSAQGRATHGYEWHTCDQVSDGQLTTNN